MNEKRADIRNQVMIQISVLLDVLRNQVIIFYDSSFNSCSRM